MKRTLKQVAAIVLLAALTTGCAVNRATATADPLARLDSLKVLHVRHFEKDQRGVDQLVAANLRARGYTVSTGPSAPDKVDAVVTYVDKWFWDITMYMLELTINVREPKTDYPLASGNSYHTSLTRKAPPEMIDEVLTNIFKEGKAKQ
jgi:hypothetical protein